MTGPSHSELPTHDDQGCNLVDPADRLGHKTAYISLIQLLALQQHLDRDDGLILDVGCGYGRISLALAAQGHAVVGVDPSLRVLKHARSQGPQVPWLAARLPDLPLRPGSVDVVLAHNLLRVLHLLGAREAASQLPELVAPGGRLLVVDNYRRDHPDYIDEAQMVEGFTAKGMQLEVRQPIRAARWPMIYLIRYGLVPRRLHAAIARWELRRMADRVIPRWQYINMLHVFRRPQ